MTNKVPTPAEYEAAQESGKKMGKAAKHLIDAANAAAQARLSHEVAVKQPAQYRAEMFTIAQARRQADAEATRRLELYIETVLECAPRESA